MHNYKRKPSLTAEIKNKKGDWGEGVKSGSLDFQKFNLQAKPKKRTAVSITNVRHTFIVDKSNYTKTHKSSIFNMVSNVYS